MCEIEHFWPLPKAISELPADRFNNSRERGGDKTRPCMDSTCATLYTDGVSQRLLVDWELCGPKVQNGV